MKHQQEVTEALGSLLEKERTALLSGDLRAISQMLPEKEKLVAAVLQDDPVDREPLVALQAKLAQNQKLLDGAMNGIRTVATRLSALRQVREALDTYDAQGRKQRVTPSRVINVERRA